jgi:hypothetical protein
LRALPFGTVPVPSTTTVTSSLPSSRWISYTSGSAGSSSRCAEKTTW